MTVLGCWSSLYIYNILFREGFLFIENFDPVSIAEKAASPSDTNCFGYQNSDTEGYYITTCKLEIGLVDRQSFKDTDQALLHIASYDDAEAQGAYIGQINMIYVSSFSGPHAAIWGYDLAVHHDLKKKMLFSVPENIDDLLKNDFLGNVPGKIPVYDIHPLLDATKTLYGTVSNRRFPILPGAHVPCAATEGFSEVQGNPKSGWIWCLLSLAIAENRSKDACLFIEDTGIFLDEENQKMPEEKVVEELKKICQRVVYSQLLCGENQRAPYKEIFIGYKYKYVDEKNYGCALACAPYVTLARNAYPDGDAKKLCTNLKAWEKSVLAERK